MWSCKKAALLLGEGDDVRSMTILSSVIFSGTLTTGCLTCDLLAWVEVEREETGGERDELVEPPSNRCFFAG